MKKRTKLQTFKTLGKQPRRVGRTGPAREKTQITIRIDKTLIASVYAQMKIDNTRLTDLVEEGLVETLKKRKHEMPQWESQTRFMVANATKEQQDLIRGLLIAMVEAEVMKPSPEATIIFDACALFLQSRNELAHAKECIGLYSRYGRSAEEASKLRA